MQEESGEKVKIEERGERIEDRGKDVKVKAG